MRQNPVWQGIIPEDPEQGLRVRCRICGAEHEVCYAKCYWPGDEEYPDRWATHCMLPKGHDGDHSNTCPSCGAMPYRPFEPSLLYSSRPVEDDGAEPVTFYAPFDSREPMPPLYTQDLVACPVRSGYITGIEFADDPVDIDVISVVSGPFTGWSCPAGRSTGEFERSCARRLAEFPRVAAGQNVWLRIFNAGRSTMAVRGRWVFRSKRNAQKGD
jgi:hypothetical protein